MDDDYTEVIVCAGPPTCPLEGDDAVRNQQDGCPICRRIRVMPDGTEQERQAKVN